MFLQCGSWGRCRHSVGRRGQDCSADTYRAEKIGRSSTICYNLCYWYRYTVSLPISTAMRAHISQIHTFTPPTDLIFQSARLLLLGLHLLL